MKPHFAIGLAATPSEIDAARLLFRAYAAALPIDLGYQDFEGELAGLPGKYAPPDGALLVARDDAGADLGCVALRPLVAGRTGEVKRLYVHPAGRNLGLGRALVTAVIAAARRIGYAELYLDTLPSMPAAQALYRSVGFEEVAAYYETPIGGTIFMRLDLQK